MRNFRMTWYHGVRWTTWTESRRLWGSPDTHMRVMRRPDGTDAYPDMGDARIREHARAIADDITDAARSSGPDPRSRRSRTGTWSTPAGSTSGTSTT